MKVLRKRYKNMKRDLKEYLERMDNILKKEKLGNKEELLKDHLIQIKFFQHERLIHLIVTVFVGLIAVFFLLFGLLIDNIMLFILFILTALLFIPYILHYYFLENGVQKLYHQYWDLERKKRN